MSSPALRPLRRLAPLLLILGTLVQAQAQPAPPSPPPEPPAPHGGLPPGEPPPPPRLTPEQRQQRLQKALSLDAETSRQLDALLHEAHEQRQPPDEGRLAQLLTPEQRQRLRALRPPHPAPPAAHQPRPPGQRPSAPAHPAG